MKQQDLEQALRASLAARADDVAPDPATYQRVMTRGERSRRFRLAAAGFAVAGVVAFAAVAVTSLVRGANVGFEQGAVVGQPSATAAPSAPALPSPNPPASVGADAYQPSVPFSTGAAALPMVTTDGQSVVLRDPDGAESATFDLGDDTGSVDALAVRPGSTPDHIVLAYVEPFDGCGSLSWVRLDRASAFSSDGAEGGRGIAGTGGQGGGCAATPVFSPDGSHLAWVASEADGSLFGIHTISWGDTGPVETSEASFGLPQGMVGRSDLALQDWRWISTGEDDAASGELVVSTAGGALREVFVIAIERQPDGAIALTGEYATIGQQSDDGWLLATDAGVELLVGLAPGPRECPPAPQPCPPPVLQAGEPTLLGLGEVELPKAVLDAVPEGGGPWLSSQDGFSLVGNGLGQAWTVRDGTVTPLDGVVLRGVVVPTGLLPNPSSSPPQGERPTADPVTPFPTPDPEFTGPTAQPTAPPPSAPTTAPSEIEQTPPPASPYTPHGDPEPPDPTTVAMPAHIAEMAQAIRDAADSQDWDALAALLPQEGDFTSNYGGQSDHIAYWQDLEAEGTEIRAILQDILALEPAVTEGGFWVWPAEFATAETYLDYRVGIDEAGAWRFFVAGD